MYDGGEAGVGFVREVVVFDLVVFLFLDYGNWYVGLVILFLEFY